MAGIPTDSSHEPQDLYQTGPLAPALTPPRLQQYLNDGYPIHIGRATYGAPKLFWNKGDFSYSLEIGSFCSIADDVGIFVGTHGRHTVDYVSTYPLGLVFGQSPNRVRSRTLHGDMSVRIGNDVWIGRGAIIMAGIKIGDGAVIGTRAVVTRDVPPYAVVGGTPARILKYRFSKEVVSKLLQIKWWNWSDELIAERRDLFQTPEFEKLLDQYLKAHGMSDHQSLMNSKSNELRHTLESFGATILASSGNSNLVHWPEERTQLNYTGASGSELMRRTVDFVEFLAREIPGLSSSDWRGLDYGSGWGRIASLMQFFGTASNLDCADAWQKSIDHAKSCGLQNQFKLLPAQLTGDELPSGEYDFIYSYSIFTHLPETHIINNLTHLMKSLKPGGKLVFTLRQPKFVEYLNRAGKASAVVDELGSRGYWYGNAQSADYGDTVVTDEWISRNLGSLGEIRVLGPLASEPFQSMTILTKR